MKIGPREQIILVAALLVVAIVALGIVFVLPQFQELGTLDGSMSTAQLGVDKAKGLLAVRQQSKNNAASTDAKWLRLANLAPESPDLPSLIVELQDSAFASGVQLISITPADLTSKMSYYAIPIQLRVIGTWADSVDFLQRIQKLNRGIRIIDSATTRTDNTEQATHENEAIPDYAVQSTILLEAYMIPASNSASATPAPAAVPAPGH